MKNINQFTTKFMRIRRKQVFKYFDLEDLILLVAHTTCLAILAFCFYDATRQVYEQNLLDVSHPEQITQI